MPRGRLKLREGEIEIRGLGSFNEIEAIDLEGTIGTETLRRQCGTYLDLFDLPRESLIAESYSDMLRLRGC